jgi:Amt family ammonium transporter
MQSGQKVTTGLLNDGLFMGGGTSQLLPQVGGILMVGAYTFVVAMIGWLILKYTIGIRVSEQEEIEGLDIGEHGNEAYHGFVMTQMAEGH